MHKPVSFLDNMMYKVPWDFEIKTHHLISARLPDLVIGNKKENLLNWAFQKKGKREINV